VLILPFLVNKTSPIPRLDHLLSHLSLRKFSLFTLKSGSDDLVTGRNTLIPFPQQLLPSIATSRYGHSLLRTYPPSSLLSDTLHVPRTSYCRVQNAPQLSPTRKSSNPPGLCRQGITSIRTQLRCFSTPPCLTHHQILFFPSTTSSRVWC